MELKWVLLLVLVCITYHANARLLTTTTFNDGTFITLNACTQPSNNETLDNDYKTIQSICLFTCLKGDCGNNKTFSMEHERITNISSIASASIRDKLFVALSNKDGSSVNFFYCGHASCTTFRASYQPYKSSDKNQKVGLGISIVSQPNGFPLIAFFTKKDKQLDLTVVECENEFCDLYPQPEVWEAKIENYDEEKLSTSIVYVDKKPIVIANTGKAITSYRKGDDNKVNSTVVYSRPASDLKVYKTADKDINYLSFIYQAQPFIAICDALFTACPQFTVPVSPGLLGTMSLNVVTNNTVHVVFGANVVEEDGKVNTTIQYAICEDSHCEYTQSLLSEVNPNPEQPVLVSISPEPQKPHVFYQYLNNTSSFYSLACENDLCNKFNKTVYDPTRTVSSKYQQRVNIIVAIIILPIIALAAVIIFAVWRIKRYFSDKANSYQPIEA